MKTLLVLLLAIPFSLSAAPKDEEENPPLKQSDLPLPVVIDQSQGDVPVTLDGETVNVIGSVNATVTGSVNATIQEPLEVISDPVTKTIYPNEYIMKRKVFNRVITPGTTIDPTNIILLFQQSQMQYLGGYSFELRLSADAPLNYPQHVTVDFVGFDELGAINWVSEIGGGQIYQDEASVYEVEFPYPMTTEEYDTLGVRFRPATNFNTETIRLSILASAWGYKNLP